jgi:chemosensory pili system protein ChpA (sensor histidine kinase/response regulator)
VLRTLGLERLALLAEELGKVTRTLDGLPPDRREDVAGILRDGLDQLRDGIEHRAAARTEATWGLIASLNELRASLSLPLVSEACLFAPELEHRFGPPVAPAADSGELAEAARRERPVLHRGLYLWYSGREPERGLRKLRRVADNLRQAAQTAPLQWFFLVLEAFVVALADGHLVAGGAIRRVLAGVDQLLKRLGESGEAALAGAIPLELVRDLLFYLAVSGCSHRLVRAVREDGDLRLVVATGADGREEAAGPLLREVGRVRAQVARAEEDGADGPALADLAATVLRLSDGLALAELADVREVLRGPHASLQRLAGGRAGAGSDPFPELAQALARIEATLAGLVPGGAEARVEARAVFTEADVAAAQMTVVEEEVTAMDQELEGGSAAVAGVGTVAGGTPPEVTPLDDDIREVFLDEATEKVETMRQQYVAWSAQRDDDAALEGVLAALDSLKSTGRLVGADTLSEVCWVLEAALRACREGRLEASDETLAILDGGIEMVDALVGAHVAGTAIDGDPRLVEQRIYALLEADSRLAPAPSAGPLPPSSPPSVAERPPLDADTFDGDLDLVELFAEEAGDLADALEEGLRGLEQDPARSAWLMEMRRALRALAAAARHAELPQLNALCEAFDGFLARAADAGTGVGAGALALTREGTRAVAGVVEALRAKRLPHLPADLIDRLRGAAPGPGSAPEPEAAGVVAPSARAPGPGAPAEPALVQRVIERAAGAGVCHLQIEEQVAVLREQVGRFEGVLALLRRLPASEAVPPRVAAALADLGACADSLHETSLTISTQLRAQGHHLTGLQQGLAAVFAESAGPTFADLLLVGVGGRVFALPAGVVESVRRLAADLVPPDGGALELRGRSFLYRHLAGPLRAPREAAGEAGRPLSVVLARLGERPVALGVDSVIGHRSLLVAPADRGAGAPPWVAGIASLGAERDAPVLDLGRLLADA